MSDEKQTLTRQAQIAAMQSPQAYAPYNREMEHQLRPSQRDLDVKTAQAAEQSDARGMFVAAPTAQILPFPEAKIA